MQTPASPLCPRRLHLKTHCLESLSISGGYSRTEQSEEAGNGKIRQSIKGVEDPRISNATRHDFNEMPAIALFSSLCGGQTCVEMASFAVSNEAFLRTFMRLEYRLPSHDSFSRVFRRMDPEPFGMALAAFAKKWAKALEKDDVRQIAIDGKAVRRAFKDASERSPLHLVQAFAPNSGLVLGQAEVDGQSAFPVWAAAYPFLVRSQGVLDGRAFESMEQR